MATMPMAAAENIARPSTDPVAKAALPLAVGLAEADDEAALGFGVTAEAPDAAEVIAAELEAALLDGATVTLGAGALAKRAELWAGTQFEDLGTRAV